MNPKTLIREPNNTLPLKEFVEKYSNAYSKNNPKIPGICYKQTNIKDEERILHTTLDLYDNFAEKMAWKIGCKKDNPQSYGKKINLKDFYHNLNISELQAMCENEDWNKVLSTILNRRVKGIGPVYSIAVLYFVSGGKYPIYDRFADIAVEYIFTYTGYPKKGESKMLSSDNAIKRYKNYINRLEILLKQLGKENANYIDYRELDRALWVFGHGYEPIESI